ncbi:hypothetical protein ACTHQ4_10075 [Alkalicoccobacillus gibsonii]|uniref:hypothetical protein n=1 Tax=Alkalicoccobacillus gibsonii TaxID=79881 RepID=UPI003F7BC83C
MELTFEGRDQQEELILRNIEKFEDKAREKYIERLNSFSKDAVDNNKGPFRFYYKENVSLLCVIFPNEFDGEILIHFIFISTPSERTVIFHVLTPEELKNADSYTYPQAFINSVVFPIYKYNEKQSIFEYSSLKQFKGLAFDFVSNEFDTNSDFFKSEIPRTVINAIRNETYLFKETGNNQMSYFAKDVYKFPFSILDLDELVKKVNDEDFKYQLDQAMSAYHQNLLLPAAATLGVVLESLCIIILENNRVKVKSGDTQLGVLKDKLMNERITTRRDNTRLEVAYKMRNMASHSSPGAALKEDCHFMLNVINTIAFEYLESPAD